MQQGSLVEVSDLGILMSVNSMAVEKRAVSEICKCLSRGSTLNFHDVLSVSFFQHQKNVGMSFTYLGRFSMDSTVFNGCIIIRTWL